MKTVTASEANRQFSRVLHEAGQGEEFVVLARGKAIATIGPARAAQGEREAARRALMDRLRAQPASGARDWTRQSLYDD